LTSAEFGHGLFSPKLWFPIKNKPGEMNARKKGLGQNILEVANKMDGKRGAGHF
jgi:hypothetical protein